MPTNRIVPSIILALWLLLIAVDLRADQVKPQVLRVFPHSVARSTILHLQPGDTVSVTADSKDEQFAVDLYVYNSDGELVGKDDEGSSSPTFNWSVAITGNYYILARNVRSG